MAVTATTGTSSSTSTGSTNRGLAGIAGNDFMNLLIKQLQYQDPLQPMTNQEMMQQMATIRQLETNTLLSDRLQQVTDQERFGSAANLIGRQVKGTVTDDGGTEYTLEGVVKSVVFATDGTVNLELDNGYTLPMANLEQVQADATTSTTTTSKLINNAKLLTNNQPITPATVGKGIAQTLAHAIGL
jgi:flagellar basal-body rod modification protein FlgD